MFTKENQILNRTETLQKIKRIAYEIYEQNFEEKELVIAGIDGVGYQLAKLIQEDLQQISPLQIALIKISLDKFAPLQSEVKLSCKESFLDGKTIVIIDDVQNTGRTIAYSLKPFLNIKVQKLQVGVLVNRGYRKFPISADYVGYELSTTINQHITVCLENTEELGIYLQ
jgi:pyrimidine operon attenuation protein/uracil phosphoribosyltransferase